MTITTQIISFEGEGELQVDERVILPGALNWDLEDKSIPVVNSNDGLMSPNDVVGFITNIQRREDGAILATINWLDERNINPNTTIFANQVLWDEEAKNEKSLQWAAKEATIKYIFLNGFNIPWKTENIQLIKDSTS